MVGKRKVRLKSMERTKEEELRFGLGVSVACTTLRCLGGPVCDCHTRSFAANGLEQAAGEKSPWLMACDANVDLEPCF